MEITVFFFVVVVVVFFFFCLPWVETYRHCIRITQLRTVYLWEESATAEPVGMQQGFLPSLSTATGLAGGSLKLPVVPEHCCSELVLGGTAKFILRECEAWSSTREQGLKDYKKTCWISSTFLSISVSGQFWASHDQEGSQTKIFAVCSTKRQWSWIKAQRLEVAGTHLEDFGRRMQWQPLNGDLKEGGRGSVQFIRGDVPFGGAKNTA